MPPRVPAPPRVTVKPPLSPEVQHGVVWLRPGHRQVHYSFNHDALAAPTAGAWGDTGCHAYIFTDAAGNFEHTAT